jgi:metal-dependent HD superfamily phosphatase/phosphodiesterase
VSKYRDEFLANPDISAFLTRKQPENPREPTKITGEVEARIVALACSKAPKGRAVWSCRLLAEKSVELNIVDSLSAMSVSRLLIKETKENPALIRAVYLVAITFILLRI